jgi:replicative DNA helicase
MASVPQQPTQWLFTPAETSAAYVQWAERLQRLPGITYGCVLDKVLIPLHPGDLMAVVARPGHGKTAWMAYMAKRTAQDIKARGATDECVIYVSWEQSVEEVEALFQSGTDYSSTDLAWGRVDIESVKRGAVHRPSVPVWLMGNSVIKPDARRPPMAVNVVYEQIRKLAEEFGIHPALICLDYLQIIPVYGAQERNAQVHEATVQAKELALSVGCPIIAGVQACRGVDARTDPMPALADAQWSSAIEQTADKQIAIFRPAKHWPPGTPQGVDHETVPVSISGSVHQFPVTQELMLVRLLKQRFDIGYGTFAVRFEPQTLTMSDYAMERLEDLL